MRHLNVNPGQRHRAKPLIDFDVPLRRKFPISQPAILKRLEAYNKPRSYDFRVKPFGFVQTISPDRQTGENDVLPIAPYETDVRKSMKLQWVDFNTGDPIRLDWHRTGMAGTIGVMRLADYVDDYQRHPEAKAADQRWQSRRTGDDRPPRRLRVRSKRLRGSARRSIGLDEEEGAALEPEQPSRIRARRSGGRHRVSWQQFPQAVTASDLGQTERGWRKIIKQSTAKLEGGDGETHSTGGRATTVRLREIKALEALPAQATCEGY